MKSINRDKKEKITKAAVVVYKYIASTCEETDSKEAAKAIVALKDIIETTCGTDGIERVVKEMSK